MTEIVPFSGFPQETFRFLRGITKNNDKAWFDAHRAEYEAGYVEPAKALVAALGPRLRKVAPAVQFEARVDGSLFRINRDIRFSKDKAPYKNHIDLWFWLGERRGWDTPGFFFRMFADSLILGAGMHHFEKHQLEAYRRKIIDPKPGRALAKVLSDVRAAGGYEIGGATRKTVPHGFDASHERAQILLREGLRAELKIRIRDEPRTRRFVEFCAGHCASMWPVARWIHREVASAA